MSHQYLLYMHVYQDDKLVNSDIEDDLFLISPQTTSVAIKVAAERYLLSEVERMRQLITIVLISTFLFAFQTDCFNIPRLRYGNKESFELTTDDSRTTREEATTQISTSTNKSVSTENPIVTTQANDGTTLITTVTSSTTEYPWWNWTRSTTEYPWWNWTRSTTEYPWWNHTKTYPTYYPTHPTDPSPTDNPDPDYQCGSGTYHCKGTVGLCIPLEQICNGKQNCPHGDDEKLAICYPDYAKRPKDNTEFSGTGFQLRIGNLIVRNSSLKMFDQNSDNVGVGK